MEQIALDKLADRKWHYAFLISFLAVYPIGEGHFTLVAGLYPVV